MNTDRTGPKLPRKGSWALLLGPSLLNSTPSSLHTPPLSQHKGPHGEVGWNGWQFGKHSLQRQWKSLWVTSMREKGEASCRRKRGGGKGIQKAQKGGTCSHLTPFSFPLRADIACVRARRDWGPVQNSFVTELLETDENRSEEAHVCEHTGNYYNLRAPRTSQSTSLGSPSSTDPQPRTSVLNLAIFSRGQVHLPTYPPI
jgi:hypothetical protein